MGTFSFVTGIIGLLIGILALFGITITLRRQFPWRAVLNGIKAVTPEIEALKPDVVIGLADGAVPAAVIALNCGIEFLYFIDARTSARKEGGGATLGLMGLPARLDNHRVLIVDNHIFTGTNMRAAAEEVRSRGAKEVRTCAIFRHVYPSSIFKPDYYAREISGSIIPIPWSFSPHHAGAYIATSHGGWGIRAKRKSLP
jgi:hypoxanthine phosphoribosyltransferase